MTRRNKEKKDKTKNSFESSVAPQEEQEQEEEEEEVKDLYVKNERSEILTKSMIKSLVRDLDASDVLECYSLIRNAPLHLTTPSGIPINATVQKVALGLRFDPPNYSSSSSSSSTLSRSNVNVKQPLELTLEYGPLRVIVEHKTSSTNTDTENNNNNDDNNNNEEDNSFVFFTEEEAMPILTNEGMTWDNEAKVYVSTRPIQSVTQWKSAYFMASLSGAVLEQLLLDAADYASNKPRFQPFQVWQGSHLLLKSSSSADFVWSMWESMTKLGVILNPILVPPLYVPRIHANVISKVRAYDVVSPSQQRVVNLASDFYRSWKNCIIAIATQNYNSYTTSPTSVPSAAPSNTITELPSNIPTTTTTMPTINQQQDDDEQTTNSTHVGKLRGHSKTKRQGNKNIETANNVDNVVNEVTNSQQETEPDNDGQNDDQDDSSENTLGNQAQDESTPTNDNDTDTDEQQQDSNHALDIQDPETLLPENNVNDNQVDTTPASPPQDDEDEDEEDQEDEDEDNNDEDEDNNGERQGGNTYDGGNSGDKDSFRFLIQPQTVQNKEETLSSNSSDDDEDELTSTSNNDAHDNDDVFISDLDMLNATTSNAPSPGPTPPSPIDDETTVAQKAASEAKQMAAQAKNASTHESAVIAADFAVHAADAAQKAADSAKYQAEMENLLSGDGDLVTSVLTHCWTNPMYGIAPQEQDFDDNNTDASNDIFVYLYYDGSIYYQLNVTAPYLDVVQVERELPRPPQWTQQSRGDFVDWTLAFSIMALFIVGMIVLLQQIGVPIFLYRQQLWFFNPTNHQGNNNEERENGNHQRTMTPKRGVDGIPRSMSGEKQMTSQLVLSPTKTITTVALPTLRGDWNGETTSNDEDDEDYEEDDDEEEEEEDNFVNGGGELEMVDILNMSTTSNNNNSMMMTMGELSQQTSFGSSEANLPPERFQRHPDLVDMPNLRSTSKVATPVTIQSLEERRRSFVVMN